MVLLALNVAVFVLLQPRDGRRAAVALPDVRASVPVQDPELGFLLARAAIPCEVVQGRPLTVGEVVRTVDGDQAACGASDPATDVLGRPLYPDKGVLLALLTSMFLHGGWLHLAGNMLFLWIFGDNVEDRFGHVGYLAFYLACGVGAALAHVALAPASTVPVVGASGAIAGVMGAYLVMFPTARITTAFTLGLVFVRRVPAWLLLLGWLARQFFLSPSSGVAWVAHVGGFVIGALVALVVSAAARLR